ncbi:MAG: hypothetical protein JXB30_18685 [Anaerolineae bacterium]|nr:hypothetical protein [Anaerolineae bacterium]
MSPLHKHRFKIALGFAIIASLGLRLMLVVRSGWRIDYDEAMIGLLGLRVLRGEWPAFVPAQPTLGAIEAYLLAPVFAVLGASLQTFRLVSLGLSAAYIASTALLARRAYGNRAGGLAALLAGIAPPYMMIGSLKTWGATIETIILGNLLLVVVGEVIEKRVGRKRAQTSEVFKTPEVSLLLMGLIAGVMFWIAWLGAYYFIPAGLLLLWRGRRALAHRWWTTATGFLVGSLPFWIFNLSHNFATFSVSLGGTPLTGDERSAILEHAWIDLLPRLVSGAPNWDVAGPRGLTILLGLYYGGLLGLLVWPFVHKPFPQRGSSVRRMLAIFVVVLPLLYLFSSYSRNALNPWGLDATGRYVLMLHTALPIGVAVLASTSPPDTRLKKTELAPQYAGRNSDPRIAQISTNSKQKLEKFVSFVDKNQVHSQKWANEGLRFLAASMVLMVIGVNGLGTLRLDPAAAFDSPYYDRLPASLDPLIEALDTYGITHVWTDVGIGQVLMFQTGERIIAADYHDAQIGGLARFPDALEAVDAAPLAAFVVPVRADQTNPPLQQALDAAGVTYTAIRVTPTLLLYIPDQQVAPSTVAQGLGYQY